MRKPVGCLALALAVGLFSAFPTVYAASTHTHSPQNPAPWAWTEIYRDDFNSLDPAMWINHSGAVNDYFYNPANVSTSGSILRFLATKRYEGGTPVYETANIVGRRQFRYGKFTARAKMAKSPGIVPGIWLVNFPQCGEIDMFEFGGIQAPDPRKMRFGHYYLNGTPPQGTACDPYLSAAGTDHEWTGTVDYSLDYHLYEIEWMADRVVYRVDGIEAYRSTYLPPSVPMAWGLLLSPQLATSTWQNKVTSSTVFPSEFDVDWIKVQQWAPSTCNDANPYTGNARNLDGACVRSVETSFNGDSRGDLILFSAARASVNLAYGTDLGGFRVVDRPYVGINLQSQIITGDFNNDSMSDALIYNPGVSTDILYGQFGDGLRASPIGAWNQGHKLIPGDFNGDGYSDVFIYGQDGGTEIRYGRSGDGLRFASLSIARWSTGHTLVPGDYNGDGYTDLFIYSQDGAIEIRYGQADDGLRFAPSTQARWNPGHQLIPGDFNGDGFADLLLYSADGAIEIRYGQAADGLRFSPGSQARWNTGSTLLPADYNGDGFTDLAVYQQAGAFEIRYGQASDGLRFAPGSIDTWNPGHRLSVLDFDGDGKSDVFIYAQSGHNEIRFGRAGDGLAFSPSSQSLWNADWEIVPGFRRQFKP